MALSNKQKQLAYARIRDVIVLLVAAVMMIPILWIAMAADMVQAMRGLGHETVFVGAHDRGARVAHRMGMDYPDRVRAMTLLDIAPTREMYAETSFEFATAYWHWDFLIQPFPLPETIIGKDPVEYWKEKCFLQITRAGGENPFTPEALDEYLQCFADEQAIHASCEDYRAAATIDIEHDDADGDQRLTMPVEVYWAATGTIAKCCDPMALWQSRAENVTGGPLKGTHYMAEEIPAEIAELFDRFFGKVVTR